MTEEKLNRLEALAKAAKSGSLRDDDKLYMSSGPDTMLSLIAIARLGLAATPIADIAAERQRQMAIEGWSPEHDDKHTDGSLARAASVYADPDPQMVTDGWPGGQKPRPVRWPLSWGFRWWKPKDRRRDLVRAGALIVAEIERLDRLSSLPKPGGE